MLPIESETDPQDDDTADPAAVARFLAAGTVDHAAWHDGTGYPLEALAPMNTATRELLVSRLDVNGWREVEVLVAVGTPSARAVLRASCDAAGAGRMHLAIAALRWRPHRHGIPPP